MLDVSSMTNGMTGKNISRGVGGERRDGKAIKYHIQHVKIGRDCRARIGECKCENGEYVVEEDCEEINRMIDRCHCQGEQAALVFVVVVVAMAMAAGAGAEAGAATILKILVTTLNPIEGMICINNVVNFKMNKTETISMLGLWHWSCHCPSQPRQQQ
jgi:hypothetical protein